MKTVAKINPELEYQTATTILDRALDSGLNNNDHSDLKSSVDNLMTVTKVLMEREDRRRGKGHLKKEYKKKGRQLGVSRAESKKTSFRKIS